MDLAVQSIQNGGLKDINWSQVAVAGAIGAASGGVSALGGIAAKTAIQAGGSKAVITSVEQSRNVLIGGVASLAEQINAGTPKEDILSNTASDVLTAKTGKFFSKVIEPNSGAEQIVEEVTDIVQDVVSGVRSEGLVNGDNVKPEEVKPNS